MDHITDKIHVMPLGDQWEVEAQSGAPLAHETNREDAIETAKILAGEQGMPCVVLHDGDGVTEEIEVPPSISPEQKP
jgi:hypothetical protein